MAEDSYIDFADNLEMKCFKDDNLNRLKFLLLDHISIGILRKEKTTAVDLCRHLSEHTEGNVLRPKASSTEMKLFSDIAELTQLVTLKALLLDFCNGKPSCLFKGSGLKPYRCILFRGLEDIDTSTDYGRARSFYNITTSKIKDIFDIALHLQVTKRLQTRYHLNRFADRLCETARSTIKEGLANLVPEIDGRPSVQDGKPVLNDEDILANLIPVKLDDKSQIREAKERIFARPIAQKSVVEPLMPQDSDRPKYNLTHNPRGICLIINNITFTKESRLKERVGSGVDEAYLVHTFEYLGFHVVVELSKTAQEMKDLMSGMQKRDHTEYDCFVCCILSHGGLGIIAGSDGETCNVMELADYLRADQCKSLFSKPKVFIIQACRKAIDQPKDQTPGKPKYDDFLFAYATAPLTSAHRDGGLGSDYIGSLTTTLNIRHNTDHILDILTQVNDEVSASTDGGQVPFHEFSLRKRLYFPSL